MPKRTTELLDVFRSPGQGSGGAGKKSAKARSSKAPSSKGGAVRSKASSSKAGRRKNRGFEGVWLNPRQVLLAGCVAVLLVVLAFTVGIGVGRRGAAPAGDDLTLQRTTRATSSATWYIRGQIGRRDVLRREAVEPDEVLADLVHLHGFRPSDLQVDEQGSPKDHWWIYYGPFQSEEQARRVSQRHNLAYKRVQGSYPFAYAKVVQRP